MTNEFDVIQKHVWLEITMLLFFFFVWNHKNVYINGNVNVKFKNKPNSMQTKNPASLQSKHTIESLKFQIGKNLLNEPASSLCSQRWRGLFFQFKGKQLIIWFV